MTFLSENYVSNNNGNGAPHNQPRKPSANRPHQSVLAHNQEKIEMLNSSGKFNLSKMN